MVSNLLALLIGGMSYYMLSVTSGQKFPPPLTREEESLLFARMRDTGDLNARGRLIEHNLRLVAHIVRKYYTSQVGQEDLISIGTIGLIKSIDSFNEKNGARFTTYAAKCIQNEILMHFRAQKKTASEISIHETIDTDRDGNPLTYIDIIHMDDTIAEDLDERCKINAVIHFIKERLTERERQIIIMRYGLGGQQPVTQREVAEKLGISRSYVSRIEKSVLESMNQYLEPRSQKSE